MTVSLRCWIAICVLCCALVPVFADPRPDDALIQQAMDAIRTQHPQQAITALTTLQQQYASSTRLPEGMVLLYSLYLETNQPEQAKQTSQTIQQRWPRSDSVLQVALAEMQFTVKSNPKAALAQAASWCDNPLLPPGGVLRLRQQRMLLLEQVDPPTFLTDGLAVVADAAKATSRDGVALALVVAPRLYLPLCRQGKYDQAAAISDALQTKVALMGDPDGWIRQDTVAFFQALVQTDAARFVKQMQPIMVLGKLAETTAEAQVPVTLAAMAYPLLVKANRIEDAKALHEQTRAILQRLPFPTTVQLADEKAYLAAMAQANPQEVVQRILAQVAALSTVKTAEELTDIADLAREVYRPLLKAGRLPDARSIAQQVQQAWHRVGDPNHHAPSDMRAYLLSLEQDAPAAFLDEAIPVARQMATGNTLVDIQLPLEMARHLYQPLVAAKREADAKALYAMAVTALTTLKAPASAINSQAWSYFLTLEKAGSTLFVSDGVPYVKTIAVVTNAADVGVPAEIANRLYLPLCQAGRYDDAIDIHQEVVNALRKFGNPDNRLPSDIQLYFTALRQTSSDRYLLEAQAAVAQISTSKVTSEVTMLCDQYAGTYKLLITKGNAAQAKAAYTSLQTTLDAVERRPCKFRAALRYLTECFQADRSLFVREATDILRDISTLTQDPTELASPTLWQIQYWYYSTALDAQLFDEVKAVHDAITASMTRLQSPMTLIRTNHELYIGKLFEHPTRANAEMAILFTQTDAATTADQIPLTPKLLSIYYGKLMYGRQMADAVARHEHLQQQYQALKAVDLAKDEVTAFLTALDSAWPEEFLPIALPVIATVQQAKTADDVRLPALVARMTYRRYVELKRFGEAKTLHETMQEALARVGNPEDSVLADTLAYLKAIANDQPQEFLDAALPLLRQVEKAKSSTEVTRVLDLASSAYAAYLLQGQVPEAKVLHETMQTAIKGAGSVPALLDADEKAYRECLSRVAVDGIFALFKKAWAAGDKEGAKKWVDVLNTTVPEHPKAAEARKLYQKMVGQ